MIDLTDNYNIATNWKQWLRLTLFLGLVGIVIAFSTGNIPLSAGIIIFPIVIITLLSILQYPVILLYLIFTLNYFLMGIHRYYTIEGISVVMDALLGSELGLICIHSSCNRNIEWRSAWNALVIFSFVWMVYCVLEIVNPSGMVQAWILSRGLIFNGLFLSIIVSLVITDYKQIRVLIFLYACFTMLAVLKAMMQKYWGFDFVEKRWLANGGSVTHIIGTGTRYFSFFTDAGNFGPNMGAAGVTLGILAFYVKNYGLKIFYAIISGFAIYGMFLSGTRGAMIVPLAGLALFVLISKNFKAFLTGTILLAFVYVFFAYTTIGQGNGMIRRMRSAFQPTNDASFNVRRDNQKKLAGYLKHKPFGEGLGLSGVENRDISYRFTTNIPNDSWYVKVWVETGIVGAILYLGGLIIVMIKCALIIMFKIKNKEQRGILSGMLCGIFGMFVSAYGNPFWGQFPTMFIAFIFLAIILKSPYLEKEKDVTKQLIA